MTTRSSWVCEWLWHTIFQLVHFYEPCLFFVYIQHTLISFSLKSDSRDCWTSQAMRFLCQQKFNYFSEINHCNSSIINLQNIIFSLRPGLVFVDCFPWHEHHKELRRRKDEVTCVHLKLVIQAEFYVITR